MGTVQESKHDEGAAERPLASAPLARPRDGLQPKGSCWYCEKPLDSVRRFCGKECADAFDEEAEYSGDAVADPGTP